MEDDGYGECNYLTFENDFEGKIESREQVRKYISDYYINILSKLDPRNVYETFEYQRLVTFDDGYFSHGYIISVWLGSY